MSRPDPTRSAPDLDRQLQSALTRARADFQGLGESVEESSNRAVRDGLRECLSQYPGPTPVDMDSATIKSVVQSVRRTLPSRLAPASRWLAERFTLAVLTKLADDRWVKLTPGFRLAQPPRDTIFDPLDPHLRSFSTWRRWQAAVLKGMLHPGGKDIGLQAAASLLLWGGPCDTTAIARISQIVPSRDFDPALGILTYPAGRLPPLRWSCHPVQKIALVKCLRSAPATPLCTNRPAPKLLRWLSHVCPDPPRNLQEILITERRYLLTSYPPWMVAVLAGLHDAPSGIRRKKHVNPPLNPEIPAGPLESEIRRKLLFERRSFLQGQLSPSVQGDFVGRCEGLLRRLTAAGIPSDPSAQATHVGRLTNLRDVLAATNHLAKQTESSSTVNTFLGCALKIIDWLSGLPLEALGGQGGREVLSRARWNDTAYQWALDRLWSTTQEDRPPRLRFMRQGMQGRARHVPSAEDLSKMLAAAGPHLRLSRRHVQMSIALGGLGLRKDECLRAQRSDVDAWGEPEMFIHGHKTKLSYRRIPLGWDCFSPSARAVLEASRAPDSSNPMLIQDRKGRQVERERNPRLPWRPTTARSMDRALEKVSTLKLGQRVTMHDLRASAITSAILSGVPLEAVSRFAGHAELVTTQESYHHALSENQGEMLARHLADPQNDEWIPLNQLPRFLGTSLQAAYRFYGSRKGVLTKELPPGYSQTGSGRRQFYVRVSAVAEHVSQRLLGKRRSRKVSASTPRKEGNAPRGRRVSG